MRPIFLRRREIRSPLRQLSRLSWPLPSGDKVLSFHRPSDKRRLGTLGRRGNSLLWRAMSATLVILRTEFAAWEVNIVTQLVFRRR